MIKIFHEIVDKTDNTETEKWALIAIARLAMNDEISNLMEKKGYVPFLFQLSRDKIPARKLAASLVISHIPRNKELRDPLIHSRDIPLECTTAMNTSQLIAMSQMHTDTAPEVTNIACN